MRLLLSMLCIVIYLNGALLVDMENNQNLEPKDEDVLQNGSTKNKNKDVLSLHSVDKRGSKSEQISEKRQENKINNKIKKIKNPKKNKKLIENRKRYNKVMKSGKKQNKGKKKEKGAKGKSKNKVKNRRVENEVKRGPNKGNRRSGKLGRKGKKRTLNHCEGPGVPTHFNISLVCLNNMVRALKIEKDTVRNFLAQEKRVHSKLKLMGNNANILFVSKV